MAKRKKPVEKKPAERGYGLWNPPPDWPASLDKMFVGLKIDPNLKLDDAQIERGLKDLEPQLAPFRTKVRWETMLRLLD